ncbi:MAG: Mu-like prophage protein [Burkholderiaceae bacterium]|nr:Mu-like prophage protein [Burkholderiaceae bacterium]
MAKNHDGWTNIFTRLSIVDQVNSKGYFDISADQIKAIGGREPRLMAKIDFREHLPPVMAANQMAILAINNGMYRIARFDPFIDINPDVQVTPAQVRFPENIITLNPKSLANESAALDAAMVSGALEDVFGEKIALTIRGRSRSPDFTLNLARTDFPVSGVQIEIDGGYEGSRTVNLVEAKIGTRSNLSIRQLIYPQRAWECNIGHRKTVRTYICFYQEPILRFIPVLFANGTCRADHANERAFILEQKAHLDLAAIRVDASAKIPVADVPFPQADRFETVLAMLGVIANAEGQEMTMEALLDEFDIVQRQIYYYTSVLRWLGLAEAGEQFIRLTEHGHLTAAMSHAEKIQVLAETIFREPVFHFALHHPGESVPAKLFARWKVNSPSTQNRRMQTVRAWIKFFESFSQTAHKS